MTIEPDFYANATLINGLPTVVIPPKPYPRRITNIIVGNSVPSGVSVYRGLLGSVPVAQNTQGNNNTVSGVINLPTGQQLFVVWSAAGSPVSTAFARVSSERTDSPLDSGATESQTWTVNPVTSITISSPLNDGSRVVIGGQDNSLISFYQNNFVPGTPYTVLSATIYYDGQISGLPTGEFYYEALVYTPGPPLAKAYAVTGRFAGGNVTQYTQQKVLGPAADADMVFTLPHGLLLQASNLVVEGLINTALNPSKTAEPTNNTAVLLADPELRITFPTSGLYRIAMDFWYQSTAAQGLAYGFTGTGVAGTDWGMRWSDSIDDSLHFDNAIRTLGVPDAAFHYVSIRGTFQALSLPQTMIFNWAQAIAGAGPTFILAFSNIRAEHI